MQVSLEGSGGTRLGKWGHDHRSGGASDGSRRGKIMASVACHPEGPKARRHGAQDTKRLTSPRSIRWGRDSSDVVLGGPLEFSRGMELNGMI